MSEREASWGFEIPTGNGDVGWIEFHVPPVAVWDEYDAWERDDPQDRSYETEWN